MQAPIDKLDGMVGLEYIVEVWQQGPLMDQQIWGLEMHVFGGTSFDGLQ